LIARIRKQDTALVVVNGFDIGEEYPGVTLDRFAPEFYAFLQTEFDVVAQFAYCRVLRPRWTFIPAVEPK
jgi:hypothetical protein